MPLYFFDLSKNGEWSRDADGTELPDKQTAHRQAIETIASVAGQEIPEGASLKLTVVVSDRGRRELFRTNVWFEPGDG